MLKALRFIALLLPLFFVSCLEDSTVVKVSKDGSGLVHVRQFVRMHTSEDDVKVPDEAELNANAKRMGEGVSFESVKATHNAKGWFGYEVLYSFQDINSLTLHRANQGTKNKDGSETEAGLEFRFTMEDGVLEASVNDPRWSQQTEPISPTPGGPTLDPYADAPGPPAEKPRITFSTVDKIDVQSEEWKKLSRGMRAGIFIQIDAPLAETNAATHKGPLYTLMDADFEKMTASGKFESLSQLDATSREQLQQRVEEIDGFHLDLQQPVRFVFE